MKNIIFDTNAYRTCVEHKNEQEVRTYFDELVKLEQSKGYIASLSPIVLMELMSHLADEDDKYFNVCKKAIIGAYIHCKQPDDNYRMLMDFEFNLCFLLFDKKPEQKKKDLLNIGKVARSIYADVENFIIDYNDGFREIKKIIDDNELQFINNMNEYVITPIREEIKDKENFKDLFDIFVSSDRLIKTIAFSQLVKATQVLQIKLSDLTKEEKGRHLNYIISHFRTALTLYQKLIINIVESNGELKIEKKKRPNLIWDFQISFCVGENEINGKPVMLITDDGAILDAAKDAQHLNSILKLENYLSLLNK